MRTAHVLLIVVVVTGHAAFADAQVIERPARPFGGLFGGRPLRNANRTGQELTLTSSLLAGYDDILTPGGGGPTLASNPVSGVTGYADLGLEYWRGRADRWFEVQGRWYGNAYSNLGLNPAFGGNVLIQAQTPLARRNRLQASQDVSYDPFFAPGTGPLIGDLVPTVPSETVSTFGLTGRRSLASTSAVSMSRQVTLRQSATAGYRYNRQTYLDAGGVDNQSHAAHANYEWAFSRTTALRGAYGFSKTVFQETPTIEQPLTDHSIDLGLAYQRRVSRTRQITFSGGGGAAYVETVSTTTNQPISYWTPAGNASVGLDLGRSWLFSLDYRRGLSVLDGISLETFVTDSAAINLGGSFGRRVWTTMSAAYSNGNAGSSGAGRYNSIDLTTWLEVALTRWCATVVQYNYYNYRLHDVVDLEPGVPGSFDRNAVRVGVTFWLPLHGSSTVPSRTN